MMPKVGQLLRWYETEVRDLVGHENDDVGLVKELHTDAVIVDWCKGPHHSWHSDEEYKQSIAVGEIVVVE